MKIAIGNDHAAVAMKWEIIKYLESKGVKLVDYVRFEKGEGLEKREDNFADEVASMIK